MPHHIWIDLGIVLSLGVIGMAIVFRHYSRWREADGLMGLAVIGLVILAAHEQIGDFLGIAHDSTPNAMGGLLERSASGAVPEAQNTVERSKTLPREPEALSETLIFTESHLTPTTSRESFDFRESRPGLSALSP